MSSSHEARIGRPLLWFTVAIAAVLAYGFAASWIAYSDRQTHQGNFLNFHPLYVVLYAPLAFGLFWPILIRMIAFAKQDLGQSPVWPTKTAITVFCLSACLSIPVVIVEHRYVVRGVERIEAEKARMTEVRSQLDQAKQEALRELRSNGVASLSEPLTGPQTEAVNNYLDTLSHNPAELEKASRHYRTSAEIMEHLSYMHDCPGPVLEIVFNNIIDLQKDPHILSLYPVLYNLAWNPNLPVPILVRMLDNPYPQVREASAANPRLPTEAKAAYLKKAAVSKSFSERGRAAASTDTPPEELRNMLADENLRVRQAAAANPNTPRVPRIEALRKMAVSERLWDRILAAQSPDCPPEELSNLSRDSATAKYVAANPAAPTGVLRTLADSNDPEVCRRAVANLTKRQKDAH